MAKTRFTQAQKFVRRQARDCGNLAVLHFQAALGWHREANDRAELETKAGIDHIWSAMATSYAHDRTDDAVQCARRAWRYAQESIEVQR